MITTAHNRVRVAENGVIALPDDIRQTACLQLGDELQLIWLPPDTIIMRKVSEIVADDRLFASAMREFDEALQIAGYQTDDDVLRLIEEVKLEQLADWTER